LTGPATIGVRAARDGDRLVVSVTDNGEGFSERPRRAERRSGGYGLSNIRQRLAGYFGERAALTVDRDEARGLTVVSVALPYLREPPATPAGVAS
jgi:two-component system sensor histidine kinase YesM